MFVEPTLETVETKHRRSEYRLQMSYETFHEWAEDIHAEWVDGEVIVFSMAKRVHQNVIDFLIRLIGLYLSATDAGVLMSAPYEMHIPGRRSYREPDLLYVKAEHEYRLTNDRLEGAADLVVEVISNDSVKRDREEKFAEYQAAGIPEYWIIDSRPDQENASFYRLDENDRYTLLGTEQDERIDSHILPNFWLTPDWLWECHAIDPFDCFVEMMGGKAAAISALFGDD